MDPTLPSALAEYGSAALVGSPVLVTSVVGVAVLALVLVLAFLLRARADRMADAQARENEAEERLEAILTGQAEITGRMQTMAEILGSRQAELARVVADRLDGVGSRVGQSLSEAARETGDNLGRLAERLAVIDRAQLEIRSLAGEIVRLQDILANKQARGAFGQARMEAIVRDALPPGSYSFQATLSNGRRPYSKIAMPNGAPALAIDAKFPLESWTAFREAPNEAARAGAAQRLRRDMDVHVRAIAGKYLLPGETQDTAILFVPSESIFADLGEHFDDVLQRAHRARVVLVSPALLMLSVQIVQAVLKDQRMREEAGRIQAEVAAMMEDMQRLDARATALRSHFSQADRDLDQILVSTGKIVRRCERIAAVELESAGREREKNSSRSRERDLGDESPAVQSFATVSGR